MTFSKRIVALTLSIWILSVGVALATPAATPPPDDATQITLENPLGVGTTPTILLDRIFTNGLDILAVLMPVVIIVGAFQMMFASGNPEDFAKGRKTILYAAIGFAIVLGAQGITAIIKSILTTS